MYYTVTENGCAARAVLPVKILPITACGSLVVHEMKEGTIQVFPNPSAGEFMVRGYLPIKGSVRMTVVNTLGQVVYSTVAVLQSGYINERLALDGQLPGGVYALALLAEQVHIVLPIRIVK